MKVFAGVLLFLFFAASLGCSLHSGNEATATNTAGERNAASLARVTVAPPQRKQLTLITTQPGRIVAYEEAPLHSKVTGYVQELFVDIGDVVQQNAPLVILFVPEMENDLQQKQALVAQAEAEIRQGEAGVKEAEAAASSAEAKVKQAKAGAQRAESDYQRWLSEHARIEQLASDGSISRKLLDETLHQFHAADAGRQEIEANVEAATALWRQAEVHVTKAQADLEAAEARLAVAQANLETAKTMKNYTTISAPFGGVVTQRNVDTGHFVHPASGNTKPLLVIARNDKIRVVTEVPEMEASLVTSGEQGDRAVVRVQSLGGRNIEGRVARTSWSLSNANRSLTTEIDVPNADGVLRPGMYVTVSINLDQRDDVLVVPISAIIREGQATYCCTVDGGKVNRRQVVLGLRSGNEVEITDGLPEDQPIVLVGAESLQQDQLVEVSLPESPK